MATSKTIHLYFSPTRYTATISSNMDEDAIYSSFRVTIADLIDPSLHIIITDQGGEKVRLHYESLRSGAMYHIATSSERVQGARTNSTAAGKTARFLDDIMQNWDLSSVHAILPVTWAPKEQDGTVKLLRWAWRFAQKMRRLSGVSAGRHAEAVQMLVGVAQTRCGAGAGVVTTGDVRKTVEMWREKRDMETYAGGLAEHLPGVEGGEMEM